ncbi:alpha/beta fold hydrolase [Nocardioides marmoraquaticus]
MRAIETQVTSTAVPVGVAPVTLAVAEHGDRDADVHVLLLHGFPDDRTMWDPVVATLPDAWHVVTVDNRGAGRSSRPRERAAYDLGLLVEDVAAVVEATVPAGRRVHLVGHDWGSIIGWEVVAAATRDPRLQGRLASWTSVSGPPLDHVGTLLSTWRGRLRMLPQVLHSTYALVFCLPGLPRLVARRGMGLSRRVFERIDPTSHLLPWGPEVQANVDPAVQLYGANLARVGRPRAWRTSLPVQVVVATRDGYIRPRSLVHLEARCRDLTRVELDQGHWVPRAAPDQLAALVRRFVERQEERAA